MNSLPTFTVCGALDGYVLMEKCSTINTGTCRVSAPNVPIVACMVERREMTTYNAVDTVSGSLAGGRPMISGPAILVNIPSSHLLLWCLFFWCHFLWRWQILVTVIARGTLLSVDLLNMYSKHRRTNDLAVHFIDVL